MESPTDTARNALDREQLLRSVCRLGALEDHTDAARWIESTLEVLGSLLYERDRGQLAARLPQGWGHALRREEPAQEFDLDTFYARIGADESVRPGVARERVQAVCTALAEQLDSETLTWLRLRLPDGYEALFLKRPTPPPPPGKGPTRQRAGTGRSLASGHEGSQRPISSAGLQGQSNSIARSGDPHADTRLSSSRGTKAERRRKTIATGRPGSEHPVSESD